MFVYVSIGTISTGPEYRTKVQNQVYEVKVTKHFCSQIQLGFPWTQPWGKHFILSSNHNAFDSDT
jgi:hypothetical protein